jgi:hypothetical protein
MRFRIVSGAFRILLNKSIAHVAIFQIVSVNYTALATAPKISKSDIGAELSIGYKMLSAEVCGERKN